MLKVLQNRNSIEDFVFSLTLTNCYYYEIHMKYYIHTLRLGFIEVMKAAMCFFALLV